MCFSGLYLQIKWKPVVKKIWKWVISKQKCAKSNWLDLDLARKLKNKVLVGCVQHERQTERDQPRFYGSAAGGSLYGTPRPLWPPVPTAVRTCSLHAAWHFLSLQIPASSTQESPSSMMPWRWADPQLLTLIINVRSKAPCLLCLCVGRVGPAVRKGRRTSQSFSPSR